MSLCGCWEQVVCANNGVVQLFDLRRSDQALETTELSGVQCMATDDKHLLLGDTAGCLSFMKCQEGAFAPFSRLTVEHGPKRSVTQVCVSNQTQDTTNSSQCAFTATALGTVQIWNGGTS